MFFFMYIPLDLSELLEYYNIIFFRRIYYIINKGGDIMSKDTKKNILRYKKDYLNEDSRDTRKPLRMQIHTKEK